MIEGPGGSGKSTLVRKRAKDWACPSSSERYFIHDYELVLFVEGRKLGAIGLEAYLYDLIQVKSEEKRTVVYDWVVENCDKCLFIVDGMDEIKREGNESCQGWEDVEQILKKELFPGCNVLLTTRVSECTTLEQYCHIKVENQGFSKDQANRYINTYFNDNLSDAEPLLTFISDYKALSEELVTNPFCLFLLCIYFNDKQQNNLTQKSTITKTKLFGALIDRIIKTYVRTLFPSAEKRIEKELEIKRSLQTLAFNSGHFQQAVFTESDLKKCEITAESDVLKIGLLTCCYQYDTETDTDYQLYEFPHRSIQDCFLAHHIAETMSPQQQLTIFKENYKKYEWCVFLCGLLDNDEILRDMFSMITVEYTNFLHTLLQYRYNDMQTLRNYRYNGMHILLSSYLEFPARILPAEDPDVPGWKPF